MTKKLINFGVKGFSVLDDISDSQYALVEIYVCHDGNNLHNMPISLSVLKQAAPTLKNKYLVAGYDGNDFEGHEPDEIIVGHFPESSKISYKKKDGKTFLVAQAMMSKVYAQWAYDVFMEENERAVSMEILVLDTKEKDGLTSIEEFCFTGVTLLGKTHLPACEGAGAEIIKFSVETASEVYSKCFGSSSKAIKNNFVENMNNLAENSGKEGTEMEEKDNITKEEVLDETEKNIEITETIEEVVEEVINEEVIEDTNSVEEPTESEEFEEDDEDESKDEEESETDDEDKEDDEDEEDGDDKSTSKEEFESLTVEQKYEVFRTAISETFSGDVYMESFDDEYVYICHYEDYCTYRHAYTLSGTNVAIAESGERVMRGGYVPFESEQAEGTTLEANTDENVDDDKMEALETENCELKEKIANYEKIEKENKIEAILSTVREDISSEKLTELRNKAQEYSLEDLGTFENEVKALAFESVKKNTGKYSFTRISINETTTTNNDKKYSW